MAENYFTKHILKCLCRILHTDSLPGNVSQWTPEMVSLCVNCIEGKFHRAINVQLINLQRFCAFLTNLDREEKDYVEINLQKLGKFLTNLDGVKKDGVEINLHRFGEFLTNLDEGKKGNITMHLQIFGEFLADLNKKDDVDLLTVVKDAIVKVKKTIEQQD